MGSTALIEKIEQRKAVLEKVKTGLIERLNLYQNVKQIDDDTPLFGSGLKLDSVDATEVIVLLDETFGIRVKEGDDPSYMRSVNTLVSFVIAKQGEGSSDEEKETTNEEETTSKTVTAAGAEQE